jgi:hypothetical protein
VRKGNDAHRAANSFEYVDGSEGSRIGVEEQSWVRQLREHHGAMLKKFCYSGDRMIGRTTAVAWEGRRHD